MQRKGTNQIKIKFPNLADEEDRIHGDLYGGGWGGGEAGLKLGEKEISLDSADSVSRKGEWGLARRQRKKIGSK